MNIAESSITCAQCSREYRWKPELAGRKVKCKCGGSVAFPPEDPAIAGANTELDLVEPPKRATEPMPVATQTLGPVCPSCKVAVAPQAVICTQCGTNLKTGKQLGTKIKGPGIEASQVAAVAGRMTLAMVVGFISAIVGAGIWIAIIFITGYAIGIVAWGIGAGVGFAMRLVNPEGSSGSGMAAAGFALLAVGLPKGLLLVLAMNAGIPASEIFSPFDLLWAGLAMSSAYKLAAGSE